MIIFVYGKDTVRAQAHILKMQERFRQQRDPDGYNTHVFDAGEMGTPLLKEQLLAVPFLAEKRMVTVVDFFAADADFLSWVEERYDDFAAREDGVFVFVTEEDEIKKNAFFKKLAGEKFATAFPVPTGDKLEQWIARQAQECGATIDRAAVAALARAIPDDMAQLSNCVHQLASYAAGEMITEAAVRVFVPEKNEDVMFALMDAVTRKNSGQALQLLEEQWAYGSEPQQVFGMVVRQYRILIDMCSYMHANPQAREQEIAQALGLHPFVVKKTIPMVRQHSLAELASAQEQLLTIDQKIKRGAADMAELLTVFIAASTAASPTR